MGVLHSSPHSRSLNHLIMFLNSNEKLFVIFGMIEVQRSVLVDVKNIRSED